MANKDIIVSSEKGTILNYFSTANTYNPFSNETSMQLVEDLDFHIPEKTDIEAEDWVAVPTGLITTSVSFLQNCTFQIIDKSSGALITELNNIIGEIGNIKFLPTEKQIFWFNTEGLRGTFYIHKNHCGQILKLVSGIFVNTSITSGVLNEMFARSIGVPAYITEINNTLKDFQNQINDYKMIAKVFHTKKKDRPIFWGEQELTPGPLGNYFSRVDAWFCYYEYETLEQSYGAGDNYYHTYYATHSNILASSGFSIPNFNNLNGRDAKATKYELLAIGRPK